VAEVTSHLPWRRKISSLNYLLASHVWRQDHNGFTHQDPGFIDHVVNKKAEVVRVYLPPDANCLLSVMDHCLRSRHYVNIVIAGKNPAPQWLAMDAAVKHCTVGIGLWQWASNDQGVAPDVVMACCGDVPPRWKRSPPSPSCASVSARPENPSGQRRRPHEATAQDGASARVTTWISMNSSPRTSRSSSPSMATPGDPPADLPPDQSRQHPRPRL